MSTCYLLTATIKVLYRLFFYFPFLVLGDHATTLSVLYMKEPKLGGLSILAKSMQLTSSSLAKELKFWNALLCLIFKDSTILKELGSYRMSFLRTNKQWKKLDEAVYASNASTWLVETRGLQIKSSLGCTVKPSLKMGMKDFFFSR